MSNFVAVWESIRRHWVFVVSATVICALIGAASSFLSFGGGALAQESYSAEAAIYVNGYASSDVEEYNYTLDDTWLVGDARRIVVSDEVAGEVRRELGTEITIETPFWINQETNANFYTRFVFVKATASSEDLALEAADLAARKAIPLMKEYLPVTSVELYSSAEISTAEKGAADFGSDSLNVDEHTSVLSTISKKNAALGLMGGLFISALLVASYDLLSRRFRSPRDITRIIDVPVLATWSTNEDDEFLIEKIAVVMKSYELETVSVAGFVAGDKATTVAQILEKAEELSGRVSLADSLTTKPHSLRTISESESVLLVLHYASATYREILEAVEELCIAGTPILGAVFIPKK